MRYGRVAWSSSGQCKVRFKSAGRPLSAEQPAGDLPRERKEDDASFLITADDEPSLEADLHTGDLGLGGPSGFQEQQGRGGPVASTRRTLVISCSGSRG
jgi:hypothetical protein